MASKTLYERFTEAGIRTENHESDLYVPLTQESRKIIDDYEADNDGRVSCKAFTNQVEGGTWLDIAFAYDPYWKKKGM